MIVVVVMWRGRIIIKLTSVALMSLVMIIPCRCGQIVNTSRIFFVNKYRILILRCSNARQVPLQGVEGWQQSPFSSDRAQALASPIIVIIIITPHHHHHHHHHHHPHPRGCPPSPTGRRATG
jgi:hypothetical protein